MASAAYVTERILNYNFNKLFFYASHSAGFGGICYAKTDLSQKIGDYLEALPFWEE